MKRLSTLLLALSTLIIGNTMAATVQLSTQGPAIKQALDNIGAVGGQNAATVNVGTLTASDLVQVGQSAKTCAPASYGSLRWFPGSSAIQICNNSGWTSLTSGAATSLNNGNSSLAVNSNNTITFATNGSNAANINSAGLLTALNGISVNGPLGASNTATIGGLLTASGGVSVTGNLNSTGTVTAGAFVGNGAGLTNLPIVPTTPGGVTNSIQINGGGGILSGTSQFTYNTSTSALTVAPLNQTTTPTLYVAGNQLRVRMVSASSQNVAIASFGLIESYNDQALGVGGGFNIISNTGVGNLRIGGFNMDSGGARLNLASNDGTNLIALTTLNSAPSWMVGYQNFCLGVSQTACANLAGAAYLSLVANSGAQRVYVSGTAMFMGNQAATSPTNPAFFANDSGKSFGIGMTPTINNMLQVSGSIASLGISASLQLLGTAGVTPTSCSAGSAGTIGYSRTNSYFCGCNGTAWSQLASPTAVCNF